MSDTQQGASPTRTASAPATPEPDYATEGNGSPDFGERYRALGARLQGLRRMRGLSLKEVAEGVGVSKSFLSMVERGTTDLSLSRFSRLTEYYGVQPSELMLELGAGSVPDPEVQAVEDARGVGRGIGIDYRIIREDHPQLVYVRMEPRSQFADLRAHRGEDFWIILAGAVTLFYGGRTYLVNEAQTVRFSGTVPHGFGNPGRSPAQLLALCSVPYW